MNKKNILNFIIIFLLVYIGLNYFLNKNDTKSAPVSDITLTTSKQQFSQNEIVSVKVSNNTDQAIQIKNNCPEEPLTVLFYKNGQWEPKKYTAQISCTSDPYITIATKQQQDIKYQFWSHELFNELGRYKIVAEIQTNTPASTQTSSTQQSSSQQEAMQNTQAAIAATSQPTQQINSQQQNQGLTAVPNASSQQTAKQAGQTQPSGSSPGSQNPTIKTIESNEFEITEPNIFSKAWTFLFYQPIYNTLIFLTSIVPSHDLGLAIILLTIIIRTILLIPSQKGLKSQRKLQELQPKLAHLKEKYKDNQEMIAKETMALWKEHKVNPLGGCLPLLIQFPILIALFYVIQNGLNPDSTYLLYEPLKNFPLASVNVVFLRILDLSKINVFVLPLIVGSLQFFQMKLAMMKTQKQQEKNKDKKGDKKPLAGNEMQIANNMMMYVMPVMIAIFAASAPAGVGLYWSTSTLYGIFQQLVVNRQVAQETAKVRVIEKKK